MTGESVDTFATRGVIVVALGSPEHCTEVSIREFLGEFLADPKVVDFPRWLWNPILTKMILPKRPGEVLEQYEAIWLPGGSPLRVHTAAQVRELAALLSSADDAGAPRTAAVDVRVAYQYGHPNLIEVYAELAQTCSEITILSTYPQYAPATTGSIEHLVNSACAAHPEPILTFPRSWQTLSAYVSWYADQIEEAIAESSPDIVVFSWHGVPKRKVHEPRDYAAQCRETSTAIMAALRERGIEQRFTDTFQSKFGPGKWLGPATIDELPRLARSGVRSVLIVNPGFMADCLETIYEMDVLNANAFREAGGEIFHRIAPPTGQPGGAILAELYRSVH